MARKTKRLTFEQMLDALRSHGFEVSPSNAAPSGMQVSKHGVAAVLVPGLTNDRWESGGAKVAVSPGILIRGEIARLLDRGYQKFIHAGTIELPATAAQLHALQDFKEELNQVTAALGLYNESLGTTSDLYLYDRLRGRESEPQAPAVGPWELTSGH